VSLCQAFLCFAVKVDESEYFHAKRDEEKSKQKCSRNIKLADMNPHA